MARQTSNSTKKVVMRGFYVGIRKTVAIIVSPLRLIIETKSGRNYQRQSYLALSDHDKKYNDWNKIEADLRKVIHNYGQ